MSIQVPALETAPVSRRASTSGSGGSESRYSPNYEDADHEANRNKRTASSKRDAVLNPDVYDFENPGERTKDLLSLADSARSSLIGVVGAVSTVLAA